MSNVFKVGDVALYVRPGSPYYGHEVTITKSLYFCDDGIDHLTGNRFEKGEFLVYGVTFTSVRLGVPMGARPEHLRKKRPPREDLGAMSKAEGR